MLHLLRMVSGWKSAAAAAAVRSGVEQRSFSIYENWYNFAWVARGGVDIYRAKSWAIRLWNAA